jgi:hypothetical protein
MRWGPQGKHEKLKKQTERMDREGGSDGNNIEK